MDSDTRALQLQVHLAEYTRTHQQQVEFIKLHGQLNALAAVIFAAALTLIGTLAPAGHLTPAHALLLYVPFALYSILVIQVWLDTQINVTSNYIDFELRPSIERLLGTDDFWHLESYYIAHVGPARPFFRWWTWVSLWLPLLLACILVIVYRRLTGVTSASADYPLYSLNRALIALAFFESLLVILRDRWWSRKEHIRFEQYRTALQYHTWLERRAPKPSLARFDLARRDLEGAALTGADLRGANLEDANLRGAKLAGANLQCANLRKTNLCRADLAGANLLAAGLWRAQLAGVTLDAHTVMPEGWQDVVLTKPRDSDQNASAGTPKEREHHMETQITWSRTVTGKPFAYEGDLSRGLVVYPTGEDWTELSGGRVPIPAEHIRFIRGEIRNAQLIPMGACRDNPAAGSVGDKLKQNRWSPQDLTYVVPLLREEGFCDAFKQGRRYMIRYTAP